MMVADLDEKQIASAVVRLRRALGNVPPEAGLFACLVYAAARFSTRKTGAGKLEALDTPGLEEARIEAEAAGRELPVDVGNIRLDPDDVALFNRILVHFLCEIGTASSSGAVARDLGEDVELTDFDELLEKPRDLFFKMRARGLSGSGALAAMVKQAVAAAEMEGVERCEVIEVLLYALQEEVDCQPGSEVRIIDLSPDPAPAV